MAVMEVGAVDTALTIAIGLKDLPDELRARLNGEDPTFLCEAITEAMRSGDFSGMKLGGWGTFDDIKTFSADMRHRAAITNQFKPASSGPFYVVKVEVQKRLDANLGFAGQQQDIATALRGGATQVEFLIPSINKRNDYIKPVSIPRKLEGR